jgi:hypothetical protein
MSLRSTALAEMAGLRSLLFGLDRGTIFAGNRATSAKSSRSWCNRSRSAARSKTQELNGEGRTSGERDHVCCILRTFPLLTHLPREIFAT